MSEKIQAFINITTEHMEPEEIHETLFKDCKPEEAYFVTGDYDYILKVSVNDMNELKEMVSKLRKYRWVKRTNTSIILKEL
ncbi:MAG: Lrp/AsnC ligand binding domain-containing protein [Candidatus Odinarchaeum yellowstonii]|uniref:Lrp/AsnC ligand binding domain-containing protein n=1 Tax=Odinarchaeota yellowstonii (strain LCB_4) TaxID=1841599 RepID=A0AAF0D1J3_ODILC|nr:MAG: Lrp/AsnC ligand binding domain-containing protein [Candidatus Odinarchaeum yellowstonii]